MNKKVIVEKIGNQPLPVIQTHQNYTFVSQGDGQNPLIWSCSVLKPPMRRPEAGVPLNVNPANTLIVRSPPIVSSCSASSQVPSCILLPPQKPPLEIKKYGNYTRIAPLIDSSKSTAEKRFNCNPSKKRSLQDSETMTKAESVQKPPSPASTSKKQLTVSKPETDTNVKPIKTPKSIKISLKNLVALDEDTKNSISSAASSVANFLEKDTSEKGLEVLDSLDDTSLTLLVTKIMDILNKLYGDYLEEELIAHLGAEKYRRIASQGLITYSEFLARRHAMVRRESPVKTADQTNVVGAAGAHFGTSKKFVKLDAKKLLMEMAKSSIEQDSAKPKTLSSPPSRDGQLNLNRESKVGNCFAEADKYISDKINFFRERDMPEAKSTVDQSAPFNKISERFDRENSVDDPINLLQVDGMNKNRSHANNYQQNETCKSSQIVVENDKALDVASQTMNKISKNMRKSTKNSCKQQEEDPFKFDPLLSRPSESILENKSVVLSSPETPSNAGTSFNTSGNSSGSTRKLDSSSSPMSPDKNSDFPNFSFKPQEKISPIGTTIEADSLSIRMSKAFKLSSSNVLERGKSLFEESPLKNDFPGFCASKNEAHSKIMYLLARLDGEDKCLKNLQRRIDEKVIEVEWKVETKENIDQEISVETTLMKTESCLKTPDVSAPALEIEPIAESLTYGSNPIEVVSKIKNETENCEQEEISGQMEAECHEIVVKDEPTESLGQVEVDLKIHSEKPIEKSDIENENNKEEQDPKDDVECLIMEDNNKNGNTDINQHYKNVTDVQDKTERCVATVISNTSLEIKNVDESCNSSNLIKDGSPSSSDDILKACDSPDLQRTVKDLRQLLKTFKDTEQFDRKSSFESGISNDSFESFAQNAKNTVSIKEDNFNDAKSDLKTSNTLIKDIRDILGIESNSEANENVKVAYGGSEHLGEIQGHIQSDETKVCEIMESVQKFETDQSKMNCENSETSAALKILSDNDDCLLVDEARTLRSISFTQNDTIGRNKAPRQQLKYCLQKRVSSFSRIIQGRIQKVNCNLKYLSRVVNAIKDSARNTTIDVLKQKTRNLYRISEVVNKTFLRFRKKNFMKLKLSMGKWLVQEGIVTLCSSAMLGKRKGIDKKKFQKKQDEMKKIDMKIDHDMEVAFPSDVNLLSGLEKPLKTYSKFKPTYTKSKSDSAISSASTEGSFEQSFLPNKISGLEDVRKSMLSRGVADYVLESVSDPDCKIVQFCCYTSDKMAGEDLNLDSDAHVKPELKEPGKALLNMVNEKNVDVGNKAKEIKQPKKNQGTAEKNKNKSGASFKNKETKVMKEKGLSDLESAEGVRKRKRNASRKSEETQKKKLEKSYALRKDVRENQPDYYLNKKKDVRPTAAEQTYPWRSHLSGNCANSKSKEMIAMKEKGPSDPEGTGGGRKRKRDASTKSGETQKKKLETSYALRKDVRENQPDYYSNKKKEVTPPTERSYPLRSRLSGNYEANPKEFQWSPQNMTLVQCIEGHFGIVKYDLKVLRGQETGVNDSLLD